MRAKKVNEGTWAIPNSKEKRTHQGLLFISKIEKLKKELYPIFGDDLLFDKLDNAIKRLRELMKVNESLSISLPPRQFFDWWNNLKDKHPNENWKWILSSLINDEVSSDEELLEYFIDNKVNPNIAQDLVEHREGFLTYGLDIQ